MNELNYEYESTKKRRIVSRKECEQDLKYFLKSIFYSVHQGIDKYKQISSFFSPTAKVRGGDASILNRCIIGEIQDNFENKWLYGKYGRFILRLNNYILLFKKLDNKNKPMNTSTKLVNQILYQQQTSLFNSDAFIDVNEPVLFVGYNMDKFGIITDVKIVFIDDGFVKWYISENENNIISSVNNPIKPINPIGPGSGVKLKDSKKGGSRKAQ